ncbi:long-chain-fatty-acid--CoA ligase [Tropicimonas isoalkanivorans]|uniref:Long-chain acyl-CoA synthetase n=1 Tax=Tropicimonas isoalkanivorans TaxID=441112 RepID=A0A1I1R6E4_9RHOB|nr:long-chain fatty acid--CoA ligase [Tropicimonas isoalkanivorans]SFD27738.1 long-chain acyl-CoA synthetase [Tropicimonas isoalkanivorans]
MHDNHSFDGMVASPAGDMAPAAGTAPLRTQRPVYGLLDDAVRRHGDCAAIHFLGRRYTYRELGALVDRAARGFAALGIGKGARVGLCLPNTPAFVISYFAVLKTGATVVNFNPLYAPRELQHQIEDSGVSVMVTTDLAMIYPKVAAHLGRASLARLVVCPMAEMLPLLKRLLFPVLKRKDLAHIPKDPRHVRFRELLRHGGPFTPPTIDPETDLAALQYTGGTMGLAKGAMLTHANIVANAEQVFQLLPDPKIGGERVLGVLPLFHVFGMTVAMNLAVRLAAEMVLVPRFDVETTIDVIVRERATLFPGVPTIYTAINHALDKRSADLSSLRYCISGGAPLPGEVRRRFETLTGCRLGEGYGLSESSPVVCCNPLDGGARDGSIGRPLAGTRVEIRDLADPTRICAPQEKGELCVRGPQVMRGYWKRDDDTRETFIDGALRTGDVGYVDEDRYYFIVDRIKDMILCSGYNVYPRAVEEALYEHPAVAEALVIGVPDAYRGNAPKAFVVLKQPLPDPDAELHGFLKDYLSPIEMPKEIEICESLPKTLVGKLSRKELIAREQQRAAAAADSGATA